MFTYKKTVLGWRVFHDGIDLGEIKKLVQPLGRAHKKFSIVGNIGTLPAYDNYFLYRDDAGFELLMLHRGTQLRPWHQNKEWASRA